VFGVSTLPAAQCTRRHGFPLRSKRRLSRCPAVGVDRARCTSAREATGTPRRDGRNRVDPALPLIPDPWGVEEVDMT
jgi:hypothetical protein